MFYIIIFININFMQDEKVDNSDRYFDIFEKRDVIAVN